MELQHPAGDRAEPGHRSSVRRLKRHQAARRTRSQPAPAERAAAQSAARAAVRRHHRAGVAREFELPQSTGRLAAEPPRGLAANAAYTWSKSIDDASGFFSSAGDPNYPQDSRHVNGERGLSDFDVRHRFSLSYGYDLPFGKGRLRGGWQTFGIWTFQTGRPFTVALLADLDNSNTGRSTLGFGANDRPNVLRNPALSQRSADRWFDTTAFAVPPFGSFGNAGRNILTGPGYQNVNVSVIKTTGLGEHVPLQFRAEAFNLLNRVNLDLPDIFLGSPTVGKIQSAQSPRASSSV